MGVACLGHLFDQTDRTTLEPQAGSVEPLRHQPVLERKHQIPRLDVDRRPIGRQDSCALRGARRTDIDGRIREEEEVAAIGEKPRETVRQLLERGIELCVWLRTSPLGVNSPQRTCTRRGVRDRALAAPGAAAAVGGIAQDIDLSSADPGTLKLPLREES
jgi:hypothetical protein